MPAKLVLAPAHIGRVLLSLTICTTICLAMGTASYAQKDKKKKKDAGAAADTHITNAMTDEQQIDYKISEMLGAWQLGDVDRLRQDYADDVVFVSGVWAPPIFGWSNYLPLYQQQRARMEHVRLDRENTFIKVSAAAGWACYQWDFSGTVDGQEVMARGQTTLVLEKRGDHWVIVHNHTSATQDSPANPQSAAPAGTPAKSPEKPPLV